MKAGLSEDQAEIMVRGQIEMISQNVATKTNIAELRVEMNQQFYEMRTEFNQKFQEHDRRFNEIDQRFIQIDQSFIKIDNKFLQLENKIDQTTTTLFRKLVLAMIAVATAMTSAESVIRYLQQLF